MRSGQINFGQENVFKSIMSSAVPLLAAQILNLLYNIVDRIYIGRIPGEGSAALAGVGVCFPIITMITAFANLFGAGGAPLCAMERGRGKTEEAERIVDNAYFMLLLTGVTLTVLGLIFHKPLLYLFGASDKLYSYAAVYMNVYLLGTVFVMTSLGLNPYINCQGFARTGMFTVLVGAVLNIILDPIFIFGMNMGVLGAALATIISQFFSALWVLRFLTGKKAEVRLSFRGFCPDFLCIKRIAALGASTFVMTFTDSLVQIACNSMLQLFGGDIYISVMTVINSVRQIAQTPVVSFSDGSTPILSYNYGAKDYKKVLRAMRILMTIEIAYTVVSWLLIRTFPHFFINIFSSETKLIEKCIPAMRIYFFGFVMMAFQFCGQSVFRALGKAKQAIFFSILRKGIIVVPLTFLLPHVAGLSVNGVFMAEPISNVIGGAACYITMYLTILRPMKLRKL